MVFPSGNDSAEVVEPGNCAFHDPTMRVPSQLPMVLKGMSAATSAVRTDQVHTACEQVFAQPVRVSCLVVNQSLQFRFANQLPAEQSFDQNNFVSVSCFDVQTERNSVSIDQKHDLGPLPATGRTNAIAPFLADENRPITHALRPVDFTERVHLPEQTSPRFFEQTRFGPLFESKVACGFRWEAVW